MIFSSKGFVISTFRPTRYDDDELEFNDASTLLGH